MTNNLQNVSHLLPFANPYLIFLPIFAIEKMIGMITNIVIWIEN